MIETILTLSRLNCSGCVRNVTKALQTLAGVEIIQTDIAAKTVHVRYFDTQATLEQIKDVLLDAHYPVVAERLVQREAVPKASTEI